MKKHLIILSGWAVQNFVWQPLSDLLVNHFEVIFVDWDCVVSIDGFKNKVTDIIAKNKIEKFSVLGWSLGSLIAIDIALSFHTQIEHIFLISGTCKFVQDEKGPYRIGWSEEAVDRMIYTLEVNTEKTLSRFYKKLFSHYELTDGYYKTFIQETTSSEMSYNSKSLINGLEYLKIKDFRASIDKIDTPVMLIHGDKDIICPFESSEYLKKHFKVPQLVRLRKAGHMPFYTKPNQCYEIITNCFCISNNYKILR